MAISYIGHNLIEKYVVPTIDWNKNKVIDLPGLTRLMLIHKIHKIFYNLNLCS